MVTLNENDPLINAWEEGNAFHLDVRQLLADGGLPYTSIMDCLHQLTSGATLVVHTLFEPKPLVRQLERLGYAPVARREAEDHWTVSIPSLK